MNMADEILFVAFPYVAFVVAVVMSVYRYLDNRFTYSSLSSQLLENAYLSWASVAWHYSILAILAAHLLAALFPGVWTALLGGRLRLYVMEITGMALAFLAIIGIGVFLWRRVANARVRAVTSVGDWVLLFALLAQVVSGVGVAFFYRWGSLWYLRTAVPWLESLARLDPQIAAIAPLPWLIKLHFVGGFVILALVPFTRLVHAFTFPLAYLWRPYRVVIWNRKQI
jgi:nitrate reductase gamma subunit